MSSDSSHLRRQPAQERSRRRVEAIVTTAARLFADQGFDKTTVDQIAAEAGVSVGSVYQFFPNKRAVFAGVSERCFARVRERLGELLPPPGQDLDLLQQVDRAIDGFADLLDSDPAFKAVWSNSQFWADQEQEDLQLEGELSGVTAALIRQVRPDLGQRALVAGRLMVQAVSAVLLLRGRLGGGDGFAPLLAELKRMIRGYLDALLRDDA